MKYLLIILFTMTGYFIHAQQGVNRQQLLEYKKKHIAESLALSEADQKKFMPVYEQYLQDKEAKQQEIQKLKKAFIAKSDAQLKSDILKMLEIQGAIVQLERDYVDKFLKVITVRQLAALYAAEKSFKRALLERFGGNQRFNNGMRRGGGNRNRGGF